MSIVLLGSTSGSITLQEPAIAGSTVLNLPATSGTLTYADGSGNLQMNSGYGSVATAYGCRAWVNFNGTGTVAIRGSGNVSSITDNGVGLYFVNFTNAMPDANYAAFIETSAQIYDQGTRVGDVSSASGVRAECLNGNGTYFDANSVFVSVFR